MDADLKQYLDARFEQLDVQFEQLDPRFERLDARFEQIDARFERLDARFEQIDARFERLDALFEQIDARFEQLDAKFEQIDAKFAEARMDWRADLEKTETRLLRAFHDWSRPYEIRVRSAVATANSFDERVALLEERISELERRQNAA